MAVLAESSWTIGNITAIATAVAAVVGVIVTLSLTLRSERLTREGQQLQREQADAAAARSEAAARVTEGYTQRVVDALESIARDGIGGGATPPPPKVRWSMEHEAGDTYRLTNVGDAKAFNVRISTDPSLSIVRLPDPSDLGSDEALTFLAAPTLATTDRTITIEWDSDNNSTPGETWRYPLPRRPPR